MLGILIVVLSIALVVMINVIKSEGKSCLSGPLVYGLNQISENTECSCVNYLGDKSFNFNNSDVWVSKTKNLLINGNLIIPGIQ